MPTVNGKKYPYTEQGKKEAAKARKKYHGGGHSRKGEVMPKSKPC